MANDDKNFTGGPLTAAITNDEIIVEEIAEYYSSAEKSEESVDDADAATGLLKFDFDINDSLNEEIYEFAHSAQSILLFCSACILAASLFLCTAFYVGANRSADSADVELVLEQLRMTDRDYIDAGLENEQLTEEVKELEQQKADAKERSDTVESFESMVKSLEKKLESAKADFQSKNDELYDLNQELASLRAETVLEITLSPGVYSIGSNLPAGTYDVTGSGSIIASTQSHETKINLQLNADTPTRMELKSGYTVKINCSASFMPVGDSQ